MWRREGNRLYWQYVVGPGREPGADGQFVLEVNVTGDAVWVLAWDEDAAGEGARESTYEAGQVGQDAVLYEAARRACEFVSNGSAYDPPELVDLVDALGVARGLLP